MFDEKIYLVNILHENIEYRTTYSELLSEDITVPVVFFDQGDLLVHHDMHKELDCQEHYIQPVGPELFRSLLNKLLRSAVYQKEVICSDGCLL